LRKDLPHELVTYTLSGLVTPVVRLYLDPPDLLGLTFSTYSTSVGRERCLLRLWLGEDVYTISDSGWRFAGAPGSMQTRNSQRISSVPAMVPRTMPAIAPPERVDGQLLLLGDPVDWRGMMIGALKKQKKKMSSEFERFGRGTGLYRGLGVKAYHGSSDCFVYVLSR
jgi:hypothetical protein